MNLEKPGFNSYKQVEEEMWKLVDAHFLHAPFLSTLASGLYTYEQIRDFAIQYSYYSRHFPRVLGAAIAAMAPIDEWWIPIADNLWDEAGRGVDGKSHANLYHTFLSSIDPNIALTANRIPIEDQMDDSVGEAIRTFIAFFQNATPLQAMSAVGLGSELFAGVVMGTIGKAFQHPSYNQAHKINTLFWELHADEHEPRHYLLCRNILARFTDPLELSAMFEAGRFIAISEANMYQKLHERMQRISRK